MNKTEKGTLLALLPPEKQHPKKSVGNMKVPENELFKQQQQKVQVLQTVEELGRNLQMNFSTALHLMI